ncbi:unnamed protein product, partial [Mycena citricolor]
AAGASTSMCGCISGGIEIGGIHYGDISASEEICTCASLLASLVADIKLSPITWALDVLGHGAVIASLTDKLNNCDTKRTCSLPAFAESRCKRDDICGFECSGGY